MTDLFKPFPHAKLARLPTPVVPLENLGRTFGHERLFMKRDDLSGPDYGGNKIRKLEFLLGEAIAQGRKTVVTYGSAGSNHALATSVCCRRLGLRSIAILAPQAGSDHVRKNLLMQQAAGAQLHLCASYAEFPEATRRIVEQCTAEDGAEPYLIPAGGTNATGALGFVQAAFELAQQIQPDRIYLPFGTGGTLAGLLVGLKLAGIQPRIEAVRVVHPAFRNAGHVLQLCGEICEKLGIAPAIDEDEIVLRDGFFGPDYGIATPEAEEAVACFHALENVRLETTYTGKTAAALLHDLRSGALDGKTVLFWNTLNSRDFSAEIAGIDFHDLPEGFHGYFA